MISKSYGRAIKIAGMEPGFGAYNLIYGWFIYKYMGCTYGNTAYIVVIWKVRYTDTPPPLPVLYGVFTVL